MRAPDQFRRVCYFGVLNCTGLKPPDVLLDLSVKMNLAAKVLLFAILPLAAALFTGCKSTPPVDWNSRVGSYTYDQAVTDLGPPDKQTKLSDGKTVAEWITHHHGDSGLSIGTGFYSGGGGGGMGVGVGQSVGSGQPDKILTLTFGPDNKLMAVSKNY